MFTVRSLRSAAGRHPRWVDAGLAALLALAALPVTAERGTGVVGWMIFGALPVPLIWRRRAPTVVFFAVFAMAGVALAAGIELPASLVVVVAAGYAVARYAPWWHRWPVVGAIEAAFLLPWTVDGPDWVNLARINAILAVTILLGMAGAHRQVILTRLEFERDQQARLAAAAERTRISREMHDIVAHNLAVMVSLADAASLTAESTPSAAADKMRTVAATGREALAEMRRLLGVLRHDGGADERPAPQPGLADIDHLVEQVRAAGLPVALTRQGAPGQWGPGAGLTVYRIVQEALTNTLKHGGPAPRAEVRLCYTPTGVDLEVTDDGSRRSAAARPAPTTGHGLGGMAERAAGYGGRVEAGPLPGAGWRVSARLRFEEVAAA